MAVYKTNAQKELVKVAGNYGRNDESVRILSTTASGGNYTLSQSISNFKTLTFVMAYGTNYYVCDTVPVSFFKLLTGVNKFLIAFSSRYVCAQYVNDTTINVSESVGSAVITAVYGNN